MEDSSGLSAQATVNVEAEDDTGELDIPGSCGAAGDTLTVPVRIQDAPNTVVSLGFDITFDTDILQFVGADFSGTLLEGFDFKDVGNPSPGRLRVGGFEAGQDTIATGASGDVVNLIFTLTCEDCTGTQLELSELKDDIATWSATGNCLLACCRCLGPALTGADLLLLLQ